MALTQSSQSETKYLKVKDGKFYNGREETPYDELEGVITDIYLKNDEFDDVVKGHIVVEKLYLKMEDGDEGYTVSFPFNSSDATSLIGFLKNTNLKQPLTLVPLLKKEIKDGVEKANRRILVKQNDTFVKAYYTRDNPNGLPQMVKNTKRGGVVEWDKTAMMDFYAGVVENELKPTVSTPTRSNTTITELKSKPIPVSEFVGVDESDSLPF